MDTFVFENQGLIMVVATLAGIGFVVAALWNWSHQVGGDTPRWRKTLGLVSISLISSGYGALYLPPLFGSRDSAWVAISVFAIPISIGLSFAIRGRARPLVLVANLFMIVILYVGVTI